MKEKEQEFLVQKIRMQYSEKEVTQLDELKALDCKVKRPANIFAYTFGTIGALVMGSGMSLVMTDIGETVGIVNSMPIGITIGIIGVAISGIAYPIYRRILEYRKKKYAKDVIRLSEDIINN